MKAKTDENRKPYEALEALMENSSLGIAVMDTHHRIIHVNATFARLFKRTAESYVGHCCFKEFEKRDHICPHCPGIQAMATGKMVEVETEGVLDNGKRFCARNRAVPYFGPDNKLAGFIEIVEDITEKKQAMEQLKQERNFSQSIVETAQAIMLVLDKEGKIVSFNPYMEEISGYRLEEVQGKDWFSTFLPEENRETIRQIFIKAIDDIQTCGEVTPIITKDNRTIQIEWFDKTLKDNEGNVTGLLSIGQDITERLQKEQELRKLNEEANKANEAKSYFLANMSHEIRTPLNAIIGFGQLLEKELDLSPIHKQYMDTICLAGENLMMIIDDILDFSKIEAGKLNIQIVECPLAELVESLDYLMGPLAAKKHLDFEIRMDENLPPTFQTDPLRIRQCLINLVNNAIKFTHEGRVTIRVTRDDENGSKPSLRFEVKDTGIGIEPDKLDHIFDVFTQADSETTRKFGGTGLGLAITKQLVELLGGTISVSSQPEKGSTFRITIPISSGKINLSPQTNHDVEFPPQKKTIYENTVFDADILVAEDSATNQVLIKALLEKMGARVTLAKNGQEAVFAAQKNAYDLIFMDIQMPVMNGYEATKRIRNTNPNLPIVALTANAMTGDSEKCFHSGMNDCLRKPIEPKRLHRTLIKYIPAEKQSTPPNQLLPASRESLE